MKLPMIYIVVVLILGIISAAIGFIRTSKNRHAGDIWKIRAPEQFEVYYKSNGISTDKAKISVLGEGMSVLATQSEGEEKPEDILAGLEEVVLLGFWKRSDESAE